MGDPFAANKFYELLRNLLSVDREGQIEKSDPVSIRHFCFVLLSAINRRLDLKLPPEAVSTPGEISFLVWNGNCMAHDI